MKYLLDTCTVSDFVKGHPGMLARMKATSPTQIVVTANVGGFNRVSGLQVENWR